MRLSHAFAVIQAAFETNVIYVRWSRLDITSEFVLWLAERVQVHYELSYED